MNRERGYGSAKRLGDILWQSMPEGREKYQMYLCSREWATKRNAVYKRSGCMCERCQVNSADHVHHLTYERKYNERLEDLQAICKYCHEFLHGKSNYDPKPLRKIYLAGKIEEHCWRHEMVHGLKNADWRASGLFQVTIGEEEFDYIGPFFTATEHSSEHGPEMHGCGLGSGGERIDRETVVSYCLNGAGAADVIFAWINREDCFGTLVELGYAARGESGKKIWIAFSSQELRQQMWFACYLANTTCVAESPEDGLKQCASKERKHA